MMFAPIIKIRFFRTLLTALMMLVVFAIKADVKLPAVFQDHMVLQRGQPIQVWGWASPREEVTVTLNGQSASVKADRKGDWLVSLPAIAAGGPFEMIVQGRNKITLSDILVGDVWICGGQSNMQWALKDTGFTEKDSVFLNTNQIRIFTVQVDMDYVPREDIKGSGWKVLNKETAYNFSAVAYHFGKYVYQQQNVPVGLISDNLGATAIETWMSNESLLQFPQFEEEIGPVVKVNKSFAELNADFEKGKDRWYKKYYYKGTGIDQQWFKPETDISDWKDIRAGDNTWINEPELKNHDGAVWFRTTFDLPEGYQHDNFVIQLSQIDDYDIAWVNGEKIGETYGKHNHRNYNVRTKLLKEKGNVLVVRVFDTGGIGGFTTSVFWGSRILAGQWVYKKGDAVDMSKFRKPNLPNATPFSSPAVLFNAMIAPLTSFPIKGAIWYQGESNANRAYEYRELFPAMIKDWRERWGLGDLPFLFVQLANYQAESLKPGESAWAELREAQAMALSLPNTGMATTIDIGEASDIHPKNKEDVGKRLGMAAMKAAYQRNEIVSSGPVFKDMRIENDKAIIRFDHAGSGLITKDKYGYVRGFQIAGSDKKFHWAQAHIKDGEVIVKSTDVSHPVAVRYAWDNNPGDLDLYNKEGLPAVPFRTDTWKGITFGKVYVDRPRF